MPTAADRKFCTVSRHLHRVAQGLSGTYDCQFVLVTNETALLNATRGSCPSTPAAEAQGQQVLDTLDEVEQHAPTNENASTARA